MDHKSDHTEIRENQGDLPHTKTFLSPLHPPDRLPAIGEPQRPANRNYVNLTFSPYLAADHFSMVLSLAVIRVAVHLAMDIYSSGFAWLDNGRLRFPGRTDLPRSSPDAELKWALYEQTFGSTPYLFVVTRGSTGNAGDWATSGWGNYHIAERNETIGSNQINFHSGFYLASMHIWSQINSTVIKYGHRVVFTGHSRGGSISQALHVIASNYAPTKAGHHYSIPFSSTPAVSRFGAGIEDNSYAS
jgi:hypothetical protein